LSSLLIFGAGGHGKVVAETAGIVGKWSEIVFADDRYPDLKEVNGIQVVADIKTAIITADRYPQAVVAIGDNHQRIRLVKELQKKGFELPVIIHPSAVIAGSAKIEKACVVFAHAVVQSSAVLGVAVIINTSSSVDHDCVIGDAVHLCPGTHLGGNVIIGNHTLLGVGVSVKHGVSIGSASIIGAGATVINDIGDDLTVVGVPAKALNET